jgi:hypothetical protein
MPERQEPEAPAAALELARRLAAGFSAVPDVEAVALGGSLSTGMADAGSDVDLYVYAPAPPPLAARAALATGGHRVELDNRFFEPGDEWIDGPTGLTVDVMFRAPAWIEAQLDLVLTRHEACLGYTTAFWGNVRASLALFDRRGWFAALQARAAAPYPEALRRAIVRKNLAMMARHQSSFLFQLERAGARGDAVAVNHRTAAFLACAFDLLFAVNREPHPGEKRLHEHARARCPRRPPRFLDDVARLLAAAPVEQKVEAARAVASSLEALAREEELAEP